MVFKRMPVAAMVVTLVYPILRPYVRHHNKFQISRLCFSAASRMAKYTKEILKNTKEESEDRMFHFLSLKHNFVGYQRWLAAFLRS